MEANPRGNPEEEAAASEESVAQIMKQLNLENKLYNKLTLNEVTFEDAEKNLDGKKIRKMIKAYNYEKDPEADPERGMGVALQRLKNAMTRFMPSDVADGDRGQAMLWAIRMLRTQELFRDAVLHYALGDNTDHHGNRTMPMSWNMLVQRTSQNLEKFFQHKRHMKVNDLNKIDSEDMLNDIVEKAKEAIDADAERKLDADAPANTEFFTGGYQFDEKGNVARDPETGIPLFEPGEDGWIIAAAHSKGAACLLGKKTNWCTASPGLNYFDQYYGGRDDPLFFIHTPGSTVAGEEDSGDRFQFAYGNKEFMDVEDTPVRGEEFDTLHQKLKDTLVKKDLEDRFEKVMNYEHFDIEGAMREKLEEVQKSQDHEGEVHLSYDVENDYDSINIYVYCHTKFRYAMNGGHGDPLWSHDDQYEIQERLAEVFTDANGTFCVGNEDCEDAHDNIDWEKEGKGSNTFTISFSFHKSVYINIPAEGDEEQEQTQVAEKWLEEAAGRIDGNYEGIKADVRDALLELGVVKKNEIDKLIDEESGDKLKRMFDNFDVYVLPQFDEAKIVMRSELPKEGYDLSREGIDILERPHFGKKLWFMAIKAVEEVASRQIGMNFGIDEPDDEMNVNFGAADLPDGTELHIDNGVVDVDTGKKNTSGASQSQWDYCVLVTG